MPLNEADIEQIALDWFAECGYACVHGPDIAPDMPASERASYQEVLLVDRLRAALKPTMSLDNLDSIYSDKITNSAC